MILVDAAALAPGNCLLTGTSDGPLVDTLTDFDDMPPFGRLYLSAAAVVTMGNLFGMVSADGHAAVVSELADAVERIGRLEAEALTLMRVRDAVDGYLDVVYAEPVAVQTIEDFQAEAAFEAELLDEMALATPPPEDVKAIGAWVDSAPTAEVAADRRRVAVHVERRTPEDKRRKTIMAYAEESHA